MGMYTELNYNTELKQSTPTDVIVLLEYMVGERDNFIGLLPDNPLFEDTGRWPFMLRCDSYYFDADTHSTLRFDEISMSYYLCIQTNLKNYSAEIENFIDWIAPYIEQHDGAYLGFYRYEESDWPILIHAPATLTSTYSLGEQDG